MTCSYSSVVQAKDKSFVPVFNNGQSMFSRYSPQKDAEIFANNPKDDQNQFFLVCGIGNGIHIIALRKRFPNSTIMAVEADYENVCFLEKHFRITELAKKYSFTICTPEEIHKEIIQSYIPVLHGDFSLLPQRAWADNHKEYMGNIINVVKKTVEVLSADLATQAHFGKIWHRNILQNLFLASIISKKESVKPCPDQQAFVAAAGPSLDYSIPLLKDKKFRADKYIIATDTALPSLLKNKIIPEIVVSIDGQVASRLHFLEGLTGQTAVVVDATALPAVTRKAVKSGCPVYLVRDKHPLTTLAAKFFYEKKGLVLPLLSSGSGTVTIKAFDLALNMGFTTVHLAGADFAYIEGKPYAKGTYFDDSFSMDSTRLKPTEHDYVSLFYRHPFEPNTEGNLSTKNLNSYRISFENFLQENSATETKNSFPFRTYSVKNQKHSRVAHFAISQNDFSSFMEWYIELLKTATPEVFPSVLPLGAWNVKKNNQETDIFSLLKLAYSQTVMYNKPLWKIKV